MGHMVRKAVVLLAAMAISVSGTMRGDSTRDGLGRHWSRRHFEAERRCRTTLNSRRLKRNVGVLPSDHCLRFLTKRKPQPRHARCIAGYSIRLRSAEGQK